MSVNLTDYVMAITLCLFQAGRKFQSGWPDNCRRRLQKVPTHRARNSGRGLGDDSFAYSGLRETFFRIPDPRQLTCRKKPRVNPKVLFYGFTSSNTKVRKGRITARGGREET